VGGRRTVAALSEALEFCVVFPSDSLEGLGQRIGKNCGLRREVVTGMGQSKGGTRKKVTSLNAKT